MKITKTPSVFPKFERHRPVDHRRGRVRRGTGDGDAPFRLGEVRREESQRGAEGGVGEDEGVYGESEGEAGVEGKRRKGRDYHREEGCREEKARGWRESNGGSL